MNCTLCNSSETYLLSPENDERDYFHCQKCSLIFVDPVFHVSPSAELMRYKEHDNGIDEPDYVNFLQRIVEPAKKYISDGSVGLDYGCGPSQTISLMLKKNNITCYNYDPLFKIQHPLKNYDFIFSTECFEHFNFPAKDIKKIVSLLKPNGYLFIMTERWDSLDKFQNWYYKRDKTHVSFYHINTFKFIRQKYNLQEVYNDGKRIIIFKNQKQSIFYN